ncbi:3'-5' exonuclease, partial [Vibrio parahaemolyticus]
KWQSLSNACAQQNVDVSDLTAHRALADCEMTRRLIHAVNSQIENQNNQTCDSVTKPSSEA